ncbi:energy transducer TonB [Falsiroseomonas sp.]|uniref:energy transducer TonB n=1 Tax=Falsiroseomonas sp. TaxID=2870721 RepID=UPI003F6F3F0D
MTRPRARRGGQGRRSTALGLSLLVHAAGLLALVILQGRAPPEEAAQQVALVWAEQSPWAGDSDEASGPAPPAEPPAPAIAPPVAPAQPAESVQQAPALQPQAPVPPAADLPGQEVALPLPPPPPPPLAPSLRTAAAPRAGTSPPGAATTPGPPREQAGGEALGAVVPARQLGGAANPPPEYPYASRIRNERGRVTLRVEIDAIGRVADVQVLNSTGFPTLDEAAIRAVRAWRFEPAQRDGVPVFSTTSIGITFQLEGDRRW